MHWKDTLLKSNQIKWGAVKPKTIKDGKIEKSQSPQELAVSLNQIICHRIIGSVFGIYYPHCKTCDLYIVIEGHPIKCCRCDADIPVNKEIESWQEHIRSQTKRKLIKPILLIGKDNEGKYYSIGEIKQPKGEDKK